jgi:hypothetical protein
MFQTSIILKKKGKAQKIDASHFDACSESKLTKQRLKQKATF